ncbi:hypothetical protein K4F52_003962 [Lecanicillium sp. MT-2017a]|nr:hypothetical protein K4F52_003962 [Lecanicillium sp. MT-2017a]
MRTRRANRSKSYVTEKYDFEDSSEEEQPRRRARDAEEKDDNFTADDDAEDGAGDVASDEAMSDAELEPELEPEPEPAAATTPSRRATPKRSKPVAPKPSKAPKNTGYLDIGLAAQDGTQTRGYAGQNDRSIRGQLLVSAWYGPDEEQVAIAQDLWDRWSDWPALPPKQSDNSRGFPAKGVWVPNFAARQEELAAAWKQDIDEKIAEEATFQSLSAEEAARYRMPQHFMPVLMGPAPNQQEIQFEPGAGYALSQAGIPYETDESANKVPEGWIIDSGGLVISMDWAPRRRDQTTQLLALAVRPPADQEFYNYEAEFAKGDFQRYGTVQLWEFEGEKPVEESTMPTSQPPVLRSTLCLDGGRARRVKWNPFTGILAVLCGNGKIYVFDADRDDASEFELVANPLATLSLDNEENILATALTWAGVNRIAAGYSDGSIALWSVSPARMLSRTPVHHSQVVDIASGYPTMPLLIASTPVGGTNKLIDLGAPSHEMTEFQAPIINMQPGLLAYGDHMRGFFSLYPSARSLNTVLGFMHHANYPLFRTVFTGECFPSCIAVGSTHPYLLLGLADGSLICLNPQLELFSSRFDPTHRIRVFQHEHRSAWLHPDDSPAAARGASRILHGFPAEKNRNPKPEVKTTAKKGKGPKKGAAAEDDDDADLAVSSGDPRRAAMQDAGTRISAVAWNPNDGYGCWAAAAMASGLVRILDLGFSTPDD